MSVGNEIRAARRSKGWTQADLADAAHVSLRTVTGIETGKVMSPRLLAVVRAALDEQVGLVRFDRTTEMMLAHLRELMANEPPEADPDALEGAAFYEAAEVHYQWHRQVSAVRLLLGVRMVNEVLDYRE